ncbi:MULTISPECIES: ABC transporter ATP-binding protein [unclassified Oceanispirochaeta]|uniref:ABC transporter ATP-binding protein n=1 Tax=unclassified Oceanispirochaeta TaxID=2635722 RepID=UPI000E08D38E|nr:MULTISPECIES: ABC transporter ATP-binding protein [unclassified Oceanispirochaeta]MBF9014462.1 ABC transporter ATP-binding protein [Oceanispirochaeta sp. M2]NPD70718.1 ABC transporter ATP-binding protein [Oceanispirochaeta sp. M1]RDG34002.1 ABC transporter ATP-binding protein [Oceanispirochaeta sp. M1]
MSEQNTNKAKIETLESQLFTGAFKGNTFKRILAETANHKGLLIAFLLFILMTSFIDSLSTYLTQFIIDDGILGKDSSALWRYTIYQMLCFVVNGGCIFGFIYCADRLGQHIQYEMREKLFNHLQELSFSFFDKTSSGWLLSRMTSDIRRISELTSWMLVDAVWGMSNILISLIFMSFIHLKLALMMMVILPLLSVAAVKFKNHIIHEYRKVRSINSKITSAYSESINGVRVVKSLAREKRNLNQFDDLSGDMYRASFRAGWLSSLFLPIVQMITSFAVGVVILYGGWEINIGGMTIGGLRAFVGYITFMLWPIQEMARVFSEMQQAIASAERVFALMDLEADIQDLPEAMESPRFEGHVEFRNVDFHYVPDAPILKDFNLKVERGETIAIVGPTGGGKTTLASLVSRYYEPVSGNIFLDGQDYTGFTQKGLQSRIGVVLQTPHLFSGTVGENILYGAPGASEDEMLAASRTACAHEMICRLPGGYDELVGEEGTLLSVGQKQLISLARTILADPDIIIMDEATSSIDTRTEQDIQHGMEKLLEGRTSFIIAHRLSTIRNADRIIVIEDGSIKEEGSHSELLAQGGHYHQLYTSQFRKDHSSKMLG